MTHFGVSMQKSAIRIVGFAFLAWSVTAGAALLVLAEVFGVLEEFVDRRKEPGEG